MEALCFRDANYPLDCQGFLEDLDHWDKRYAQGMADRLGLEGDLTLAHWRVIFFVRKTFKTHWTVPRIHETCRHCRLSRSQLRGLFPAGYARGVCRIAGIPYAQLVELHYALTYEAGDPCQLGYEVTAQGFLRDFWTWDDGFAIAQAHNEHIPELTLEHWKVIDHIRARYASSGEIPSVRQVCLVLGLTLRDWQGLFPGGYRSGAWRMAGLPAGPHWRRSRRDSSCS